ncbi:MAG: nitrogen regulation protein NR(I), partial [Gammaproteobacteria bacterium]|nr:nitrogen regulation protein NR(I) [Gammaproteobacteria bacterium]
AEQKLNSGASGLLEEALPQFERLMIEVALKKSGGHRQEAAQLLGWGRNTITRKIKELGMEETG